MKRTKITIFRFGMLLLAYLLFIFLEAKYRLIVLLISLLSALLFGRLWCGYVCPLGFYQEILSFLRKNTRIPSVHNAKKVQLLVRVLKWIVFAGFLFSVVFWGLRPSIYIRPDQLFTNIRTSAWWLILTGIFIGLCFVQERFFCKICPLGTLRGIFNRGSFSRIRKNPQACTHCRACLECCPMDIESIYLEREKKDVTHSDCIYCMKCIEACPEEDALSFAVFGKKVLTSHRKRSK
ncbi:4Fe-4S binding protein [Pseudoramibacter alactolyticus]|uniref:4Fe-4S binding protein n=1 Tax=Pseudoramibacter alactolyticus TaxID=113287 RepID=UPI0028E610F0|nr:4Fe-4S binding protein [Pseudoramibacter alactolyticus]